jgi:pimeloyl-ACP methyl ester carboxylesterase
MSRNTTGLIDLGDGTIYYESAGEGVPLVFLHAVPFDSRMWDDQWHDFSQSNSVLRYDLRGFGMSDRLEGPVSRRQELYRLLEGNGVERANLVGCSVSGETIMDAALEHPELVSALIIVSAVPGGFEMQGEPPMELMQMMAALEQEDLDLASELSLRIWLDGPFRQPQHVDPLVRRHAAEMNRNALAKGSVSLMFAPDPNPLDPPAVQRLGRIQAPTLILAGELDNPEILRAADVMAEAIPEAQKVIIPNAAHLPNMEKPAEFNQIVKDYLSTA